MEAAAALLMLESTTLKEADVVVEVVAGDADSSTAAAIRNTYGDQIQKALDLTHAKKNFKNQLFALQKHHSRLSKQAILYLTSTVGAVLNQNKGNPEMLSRALKNVPEHTFNRHDNCNVSWCRYKTDPENYKSRYLAKTLGEYGCELHTDLCTAIDKLVNKAEELSVGGSTQANESFNNQVCSKNPKYKHYSGTESLTYRVHCAVLQKNEGVGYVSMVNQELSLSPGDITHKYKERLKMKRRKEAALRKEPKEKAKRKLNFARRGQITARLESSEGLTYSSGMVFNQSTDKTEKQKYNNPVASKLKLWRNPPLVGSLNLADNCDYHLVFFDLETGGFATEQCDILQISALSLKASFDIYCLPSKNITPAATAANSISYRNNALFYKGAVVPAIPIKEALTAFIAYLKLHRKCVMVAHNALFDTKFLVEKLLSCGLLDQIEPIVIGYIDTLKMAKIMYSAEKKEGTLVNFKLATICKFVLGDSYTFDAHNAAADVEALKEFYT
jgi:DNA polymerase III epsilon subunit-like protein